jgi:hypothetical protein
VEGHDDCRTNDDALGVRTVEVFDHLVVVGELLIEPAQLFELDGAGLAGGETRGDREAFLGVEERILDEIEIEIFDGEVLGHRIPFDAPRAARAALTHAEIMLRPYFFDWEPAQCCAICSALNPWA